MHPKYGVGQLQEKNLYGLHICQFYNGSGRIEFNPQEVYGSWKMTNDHVIAFLLNEIYKLNEKLK